MNERFKVWEIWHESPKTGILLTESKHLHYARLITDVQDTQGCVRLENLDFSSSNLDISIPTRY